MAAKNATSGAAALRYANALIDISVESKALDSVEKDLADLAGMLGSSADLQAFTKSPVISRDDHKKAIVALADTAKFHILTKNFLALLAENRRLADIGLILKTISGEIARRRGLITARVQVAQDLTPAQAKALQKALADSMGQPVTLEIEVKKDLLGGMIVTVGSKMIDDSVKRKLERLKIAMQSGANQNSSVKKVS